MLYAYLKALHIIFVVTWFAGLFYMPRLFIYNIEAGEKEEAAKNALRQQFGIMMKRLWYGITWPSAIITLILGPVIMFLNNWHLILLEPGGYWLTIKLLFVVVLYVYFYTIHLIFKQQINGVFKYTSQQLRIWNEVATILLVAIVMLATVKQSLSFLWASVGFILFIIAIMSAIKIYKILRMKKS
ncbi:CopD family protein [Filimonas effusa]|uniref:Protoporphyrinogen IX oxidase n=1 Tax=Filimonas effusa TaxID=2508721 RepID=A0A4Q1D5N5_9BACT|nr:CopD family protein [Filimonas effusa]RXK83286.1 protoporphyrinogen IX oxidase [Filimonas effusa]